MHEPRPHRRSLRGPRIVLGLVAASTLLAAGPVHGQEESTASTLGGFTGSAASSGMHAIYAPEGLLPTGPPLDLGVPDALATIASGPSTFARASAADPGDLLANPGALLALASSSYKSGTIPAYPYRVTAESGVGEPSAESNPAPGLNARVHAEAERASAEATMPAAAAPAVATFGSMHAAATTETDGSTVTIHSRTEISAIDIVGVLHIDSVVTDLTGRSDGGDPVLEGGTTVSGAKVLGRDVKIGEDGIEGPEGDALEQLGIKVSLPGPIKQEGGGEGQLASTGLRIDIEASTRTVPGLGTVLDALPPLESPIPGAPSAEDVVAAARARHLMSAEMGRGVISLSTRGLGAFTDVPLPSTPEVASLPAPTATGALQSLAPPAAPAPAVASTPTAPIATTEVPTVSLAAGIGALAALLLLLQPFLGDRLFRVAAAQLATDQEACPWERR